MQSVAIHHFCFEAIFLIQRKEKVFLSTNSLFIEWVQSERTNASDDPIPESRNEEKRDSFTVKNMKKIKISKNMKIALGLLNRFRNFSRNLTVLYGMIINGGNNSFDWIYSRKKTSIQLELHQTRNMETVQGPPKSIRTEHSTALPTPLDIIERNQ